jgi:hypothetical protein
MRSRSGADFCSWRASSAATGAVLVHPEPCTLHPTP